MKKIYLILIALLFTLSSVYSQRVVGDQIDFRNKVPALENARDVTDTLGATFAPGCDPTPILFGTQVGGFVTGGNGYGDLEKAQYFETESAGMLHSVLVWVGAKEGGTGTEMYRAKLYEGDLADGPATEVAVSEPVSYADLDTVNLFTRFEFSPEVSFDGSFFISLEVSEGDAIYGIIHTDDGCGNGSAWEMWDDMNWYDIDGAWGGLDIVMYVLAEVEILSVGIDGDHLIEKGSDYVFPNPATSNATLVYNVTAPSEINVHVYTTTGVLINSYGQGIQPAGMNQLTFDTGNLSPGMYIYSIQTDNGFSNGRFAVTR